MTPIKPIIGPYHNCPAVCQNYDPRTAEVARHLAATIQSRLPDVSAEHIGSTSVPGCAGKGIVDLMLVYPDGQLAAARNVLDAVGFQRQTSRDPFPEERPMRTGSVDLDGTTFLVHVHVIAASSSEAEELRSFRDRLRRDPVLTASYVAAKKAILAKGVTDSVDYAILKGDFVEQALHNIASSAIKRLAAPQLALYQDPFFTFRFADKRIVSRMHLESVQDGRPISVFKIDPDTGAKRELLAKATVSKGGWVDFTEPIIVKPGDVFIAVPEPGPRAEY